MLNEKNKHSWCSLPYINLSIEPDGRVTPCCKNFKLSYKTELGNKTINKESVINFWHSKDRINLIDQLESGKRVKSCFQCWEAEDAGKKSFRMIANESCGHLVEDKTQLPKLVYIATGNTCNLKCRICWPDRSSQILEENKNLSLIGKIQILVDNSFRTGKESFSEDNDNFWKNVIELFPKVTSLVLSGGEPMYVKNNQKFVKNLVDLGYAKNIDITYNTNGTLYPEKHIDALKEFRSVTMKFSIDAINEKFRYIRHPGNFETWEKNTNRILTEHPNWNIEATISVSIFNIWDIPEVYEYCTEKNLNINLDFVYDSRSAKFMPLKLKSTIIEKLLNHQSKNPKWDSDRDFVIKFLQNHKFNYIKWKLFWKEVKQRDEYRNESFEKTFPDFYQQVKKYL